MEDSEAILELVSKYENENLYRVNRHLKIYSEKYTTVNFLSDNCQ